MKFIFEVLIEPDYSAEQYAEAWVEASQIIQQAAGAEGTYLHRDLNDDHRLLAIAHWSSKSDRDASETSKDERVRAIIDAQAKHVKVNLIGEFAEPDWSVVLPKSTGGAGS